MKGGAYHIRRKGGHFPLCGGLSREDGERIVALLNDTRTIPTVALKEHLVLSSLRHVHWLAEESNRIEEDDDEPDNEDAEYYLEDARQLMERHKFQLPPEE